MTRNKNMQDLQGGKRGKSFVGAQEKARLLLFPWHSKSLAKGAPELG